MCPPAAANAGVAGSAFSSPCGRLADGPTLCSNAQVCEQGTHQDHDYGGSKDEAFGK
jgi:hypothetical protein